MLAPVPAHAQLLKRIKQAAAEKGAEAAGRKAADAVIGGDDGAKAAAHAPEGAASRPASSTIEITTASIDTFLESLRPVMAAAERRAARTAAEEKVKRYDACIERVSATVQATPPSAANIEKASKVMERQVPVRRALAEAAQRNDEERMAVLQDSLVRLGDEYAKAMFPQLEKCGPRPSLRPLSASQREADAAALPARPAGMSATQYGRLRERIALYLLTDGAQGSFSPAELAALGERKDRLSPLTPMFKDGALQWSSWYDLNQAWR